MNHVDIYKNFAEDYFKELGISYERTRKRQIALPMGAFASAMHHKLGPTELGRIFKVHHATIIYHQRVHDDRMMYSDYRFYYEKAVQKVQEAVAAVAKSRNAIHIANSDSDEILKLIDVIDNESWIAIDLVIEKLCDEYGLTFEKSRLLNNEIDMMSKSLCTMLLRHVQLETDNDTE